MEMRASSSPATLVIIACALLLLIAIAASAQPPGAPESYTLRIYAQGAASPLSTYSYPHTDVVCGLPDATPAGIVVNPSRITWDDPDAAGMRCEHAPSDDGVLLGLPMAGLYEATLTASNDVGESTESNRAPFDVRGAPTAPALMRMER